MDKRKGEMKTIEAKVVVLGSQGVGKTSVVIRYVGGMFSKHTSPTIGASFFTYKLMVDNARVKLQVWDTAGQERFRSMAPMYYRKANAAMLVYDITSLESFYDIKVWVQELKKNVNNPIILCLLGNKSDLEHERKVSTADAEEYAASIEALFFETSAVKNTGIEESFLETSKELVKLCESSPSSGLSYTDNSNVDTADKNTSNSPSVTLTEKDTETPSNTSENCGC